jgi:two-component system cell cycle sensor histidine kinase/response regulator CckA
MVRSVTCAVDAPSGSKTILVVEDDGRVIAVISSILRRHGYRVLQAQTGDEAVAVCERHPEAIDLLLADVVLARATGPRVAARLVSMRPQLQVLYMSGHTASAMLTSAVLAAGARFLQKPITPAVLIQHVHDVIGAPRKPAPA